MYKKLIPITILAFILSTQFASASWYDFLFFWNDPTEKIVLGGPFQSFQRSMVPIDSTENLGTSTSPWDELHVNEICLSASCRTSWPTGGGGSGGGTWSTTTSQVSGQLINYPNNDTDIVSIGSSATTSSEWWYDPNVFIGFLKGKLGIGTTTPYAALSVVGSSGVVADKFVATSSNLASTIAYRLGIATTSPAQPLDVAGVGIFDASIRARRTDTGATVGSFAVSSNGVVIDSSNSNGRIIFTSGGSTEVGRFTSGGNFGIGTNVPDAKLHVQDDNTAITEQSFTSAIFSNQSATTDDNRVVMIAGNAGENYLDMGDTDDLDIGGIKYDNTLDKMSFFVNTVESVAVTSNNNVGIGTTTPYATLAVAGKGVIDDNLRTSFIVATSTTATSTFAAGIQSAYLNLTGTTASSTGSNGISLSGGCFAIRGVCVNTATGSGTVTSVATNNGLTGGTITTSGTIGLDVTKLMSGALTTWDGTQLVATGTPKLTVGFISSTSTTATSTFLAGLQSTYLNLTGASATSTASNGFNLTAGCFAIAGVCISGGSGSGTVTSVAQTVPSGFAISGSPVTTSGTLAIGFSAPINSLLISDSAGTGITATSAPTVNYITSTSTTVSRFAGDVSIGTENGSPYLETAGADASPPFSFVGDLDTGMYRNNANTVSFATAGVGRVHIVNTGMGIATATPNPLAQLNVHGNGYISSNLFVGGVITSTSSSAHVLPYASTTMITATTASSSNYFGGNLVDCDDTVNSKLLWSDTGKFSCGADQAGAGGAVDGTGQAGMMTSWTDSNTVQATSTIIGAQFIATSTTATSTLGGGLTLGGYLKTNLTGSDCDVKALASDGTLYCGTDASGGTGAYPFTPSATGSYNTLTQATTGIAWFQNGVVASSTSRFATSTFANAVGIGTTTIGTDSLFGNGLQKLTVQGNLVGERFNFSVNTVGSIFNQIENRNLDSTSRVGLGITNGTASMELRAFNENYVSGEVEGAWGANGVAIGTGPQTKNLSFYVDDGVADTFMSFNVGGHSLPYEMIRLNLNQFTGIGTSSPYAKLTVWNKNDAGRIFEVVNSASSTKLWVSGTGFGTTTLAGLNISGSATSTSNVGFNLTGGCYAVNGSCINIGAGGSGTVTSVATNNGLTGGTITTSGTIGLDITKLSSGALTTWDGTQLVATGTPKLTVGFISATSTTATSTFLAGLQATYLNLTGASATSTASNGFNLTAGCFSIRGTCIDGGGGSGTVTSIATNAGLTGGTITTSGTLGLDATKMVSGALLTWDGTQLVATGTPQLTVGNLLATSTTATSTFIGPLKASATTTFAGNVGFGIASTSASAAQYTVNWSSGTTQRFILNQNSTFILNATSSNPMDGGKYILKLCQGAAGGFTGTFVTSGNLLWSTGTTTLSTTANTCTYIGFLYDYSIQKYTALASTTALLR